MIVVGIVLPPYKFLQFFCCCCFSHSKVSGYQKSGTENLRQQNKQFSNDELFYLKKKNLSKPSKICVENKIFKFNNWSCQLLRICGICRWVLYQCGEIVTHSSLHNLFTLTTLESLRAWIVCLRLHCRLRLVPSLWWDFLFCIFFVTILTQASLSLNSQTNSWAFSIRSSW